MQVQGPISSAGAHCFVTLRWIRESMLIINMSRSMGGAMKRLLFGSSLLILLIIMSITMGWGQQATGPRMVIEKKYFNAKQVNEGEIIEHAFTVRNEGDSPHEIKRLRPG